MQWLWSRKQNQSDSIGREQLQNEGYGHASWEKPLLSSDYFVIDMETSGFSPQTDLVLSIAAAAVNYSHEPAVDASKYELIAHGDFSLVPEQVWQLTGLSPEQLANGREWREVLFEFLQFAAQRVWVAHHARHELSFLQKYTREFWKLRIQPIVIDTAVVAQALLGLPQAPSLDEVCAWLDIVQHQRHHADGDVRLTTQVWQKEAAICQSVGLDTVGEVIEWTLARAHG